ncbi:hypothetical protein V8D89_003958 [Ganoderma adspersum]
MSDPRLLANSHPPPQSLRASRRRGAPLQPQRAGRQVTTSVQSSAIDDVPQLVPLLVATFHLSRPPPRGNLPYEPSSRNERQRPIDVPTRLISPSSPFSHVLELPPAPAPPRPDHLSSRPPPSISRTRRLPVLPVLPRPPHTRIPPPGHGSIRYASAFLPTPRHASSAKSPASSLLLLSFSPTPPTSSLRYVHQTCLLLLPPALFTVPAATRPPSSRAPAPPTLSQSPTFRAASELNARPRLSVPPPIL